MKSALIIIDMINDIIHENGKVSAKGYANFAKEHSVLEHTSQVIKKAREKNIMIIHVRVGFSKDYKEQPKHSPLFGKAHEFGVLQLNSWATEFHEQLDVQDNDLVITKHRVSPFYGTPLQSILNNNQIESIYIAGVATDLAVESAARDAHDRDFNVTIIEDCCAAANSEDHQTSLLSLKKIASIATANDVF